MGSPSQDSSRKPLALGSRANDCAASFDNVNRRNLMEHLSGTYKKSYQSDSDEFEGNKTKILIPIIFLSVTRFKVSSCLDKFQVTYSPICRNWHRLELICSALKVTSVQFHTEMST